MALAGAWTEMGAPFERRHNIPDLIVALAHDAKRRIDYVRGLPGDRIYRLDARAPGGYVRLDIPRLPATCSAWDIAEEREVPPDEIAEREHFGMDPCDCGLAVDWASGLLFADVRNSIYIIDPVAERIVGTFRVPLHKMGGLGYHQVTGSLWAIDFVGGGVFELDLAGNVLDRFHPGAEWPSALSVESKNNELVVDARSGMRLVDISSRGLVARELRLTRTGIAGGAATGGVLLRPLWTQEAAAELDRR